MPMTTEMKKISNALRWGVAMNGLAQCKYEADERRKELLQ
jgi:hypothetical protein